MSALQMGRVSDETSPEHPVNIKVVGEQRQLDLPELPSESVAEQPSTTDDVDTTA